MSRINPVEYGGIVGGGAFCNRQQEQADLARAAENGDRLFVYAERRMGKTSLVKQVLRGLDAKQFLPVYVDLWPTDGTEAFVAATAKALAGAAETRAGKAAGDEQRSFSRGFSPRSRSTKAGNPLASVRRACGGRAGAGVGGGAGGPAEARPEAGPPGRGGSSTSSSRCSSTRMTQRSGRSTARPGTTRSGRLRRSTGCRSSGSGFEAAEKPITDEQVEALCALTEGHPFYTQHLAHALWERTPPGTAVEDGDLSEAMDLLLRRESYAFVTRWETLTKNQQRFLRGVAETPGVAPFSSEVRASARTQDAVERAASGGEPAQARPRGPGGRLLRHHR